MSQKKRKHYDEDFKRNAVSILLESGEPVTRVADQLGIEQSVLYKWSKRYEDEIRYSNSPNGKSGDYQDEIRKLRQEISTIRTTVDSLRKVILKTLGDRYLDSAG